MLSTSENIIKQAEIAISSSDKKGIIICGPTASGKTATSIEVAKYFGGEIVSCDAYQIYRYMDIGTAKATASEQASCKHHMIDVVDPWQSYNAAQYKNESEAVISELLANGKIPTIVGGTGLYVNALLDGRDYDASISEEENYSDEIKEKIDVAENFAKEGDAYSLHCLLNEIDPEAASNIHPNNIKRVLRYVIMSYKTGKTLEERNKMSVSGSKTSDFAAFCILPERESLYEKCDKRVQIMRELGLTDEVREVLLMCEKNIGGDEVKKLTSLQAIGYKELLPFVSDIFKSPDNISLTEDDAYEKIKLNTRHFVKRQFTWFRKTPQLIVV